MPNRLAMLIGLGLASAVSAQEKPLRLPPTRPAPTSRPVAVPPAQSAQRPIWPAPATPDALADAFVAHVTAQAAFPESAKKFVAEQAKLRRGKPELAKLIPESLAILVPDFKAALDALAADDTERALALLRPLATHADPYVAVHAAYFAAEALVAREQPIDADAMLKPVLDGHPNWPQLTPAAGELGFLAGFTALQALRYDEASDELRQFLAQYPAAPERMRRSAEQMLIELSRREPKRLGDVHDLMAYAGRELEHGRTSDDVRGRQKEALDLLNRLIEEAEKREQDQQQQSSDSSGRGGSKSQKSGKSGGNQPPKQGAERSTLPDGPAGPENLGEAKRVRPGESWGKMPPKEREALLQALQQQFPSQYRDLVEQYYRQLSKDSNEP